MLSYNCSFPSFHVSFVLVMVFLRRSYVGNLMVHSHFLHTLVIEAKYCKCLLCIYFFCYFLFPPFLHFFPFSYGRHSVERCLSVKLWGGAISIPLALLYPHSISSKDSISLQYFPLSKCRGEKLKGPGKGKPPLRSYFIILLARLMCPKSWHYFRSRKRQDFRMPLECR